MSFAHTTPFSQPEQDRRSPFAHLRPNSAWYCYRARVQRKTPLRADQVAEGQRLAVADIDFVESETGMQQNCRVLEIGCGWGRHSLELARRGYRNVISLDVCSDQIRCAHAYAKEAGYTLHLQTLDFLDYQTDIPFDMILSLYDRSCVGQPDEMQDRSCLEHLARMVRPGGYLVFGIRDWPRDLPHPSRSWEETEEGIELHEVLVDTREMKCTHRTTLVHPDWSRETYELTRRHYRLPEVRERLAAADFHLAQAYHAFDRSRPYGPESQGLVVIATKGVSNGACRSM